MDVGKAIAAVNRLIEPTARAHSVQVEAGQPPEPIHVRADEAEFQNALINLLLNAVQACQPGGRVTVGAAQSGGHLRIRVADTGCGIAAENRKHIFEPFFSLRKGGTGLGLFLTLKFVRDSGGDVSVESAPGAGSTFEIVLPEVSV